jgi:NAD(P)-dependent dehydrogenase (short-subunit alcohol dehydrogenase family)
MASNEGDTNAMVPDTYKSQQAALLAATKGTFISTGAGGGIGAGFLSSFLSAPSALLYHSIYTFDPFFPGSLRHNLLRAPLHSHELVPLDLSSLADVRKFAASINERVKSGYIPPIRALVLIGGGIFNAKNQRNGVDFTSDGFEKSFQINYLANFLLVLLLLQSMDKTSARIIFISSISHNPAFPSTKGIYLPERRTNMLRKVEELAKGTDEIKVGEEWIAAMRRYGTSKLLMNMFMCVTSFLKCKSRGNIHLTI